MALKTSTLLISLFAVMISAMAFANDAPPTDESIDEMMRLTHAEENFGALKPQIETAMRKTLDEAVSGRQLNQAQQAAYERGRERMLAVMSAKYTWSAMRDLQLRVYQAAFTQDELNGVIAFYRTPAGIAWVNKMPLLQQHLIQETQSWMRPLIGEFRAIAEDMRAEIDRAAASK
jgi:hypothetical protein